VLHFFGSKAFLFAAAMTWPFDTDGAVEEVLTGPRAQLGERLAPPRYIVAFEPLASLETERVVELVGPALQRYMTGEL
jgi:hypothetical protein